MCCILISPLVYLPDQSCCLLSPVVQLLLHHLQLEVTQAESSLLQAAASCPLYGRAHCITAVLQQLHAE